MITFTPIASSSKGNAYLLESEGVAPLLLEAGLPICQLREKIGFKLTQLAGCLVSHEHMDHARAIKDLLKAGVDCWMSQGTAIQLGVNNHHRIYAIDSDSVRPWLIERWSVIFFHLKHDAVDPTGFLISDGDDRLLFIPDTAYIENRFKGLTTIAIECNHIADILSKNIQEGHLPAVVGRRVRHNHMSLETVISMLKANDLSKCRQIYLLHLSDGNADEKRMKDEVQRATGIPTEVC